jgi:CVNH domain
MVKSTCGACVALLLSTGAALSDSTFPFTCSNIQFVYVGKEAALQAECLKADGNPNKSTLILTGITNQNGKLVQGTGPSTFQQSCGTIQILASGPVVTLSAQCRAQNGQSNPTSLSLNDIKNNNGTLGR